MREFPFDDLPITLNSATRELVRISSVTAVLSTRNLSLEISLNVEFHDGVIEVQKLRNMSSSANV